MIRQALIFIMLATSTCVAADAGYLFVTFKGERTPMSEQVYFVISRDGKEWTSLNGGEPVLVSMIGEKGVRDPFLLRAQDGGRFFLIATDLSIHLNPNWGRAVTKGSRSIVIWESTDLVKWSEPRLVKVAADGAGCTWAPEAVYDEKNRNYLVFWASKTAGDNFKKHRIWAARTSDFATFSEPFIFIDKPNDVIDTTIVFDGGKYYRFSKDERFKAITLETSDTLEGEWADVPDFSLARLQGFEGPACYRLTSPRAHQPATWSLLLDHYSKGEGYKTFITTNLATGDFKAAPDFRFPFKLRHGSVLPISADELARLEAGFKAPSK